MSAPYPQRLCQKIVEAFEEAQSKGQELSRETREAAGSAIDFMSDRHNDYDSWLCDVYSDVGHKMISLARQGHELVSSSAVRHLSERGSLETIEETEKEASEETQDDVFRNLAEFVKGPNQFDRERIMNLQRKDDNVKDIIVALELRATLVDDQGNSDWSEVGRIGFFDKLKKIIGSHAGNVTSRCEIAMKSMNNYSLDGLLYRLVRGKSNNLEERTYIPKGSEGLRCIWYNGRRYNWDLRRTLMLLYHDSEMSGGHTSIDQTYDKIAQLFWWPTMQKDVARWVHTCIVCMATKPTPAVTTDQRMELYERPFRMIFIDTVGPINPPDGIYRYIAHAECPFSRYCWLEPIARNDANTWARFLVERVFLDVAGFPTVLRSDRGSEFTNQVVK